MAHGTTYSAVKSLVISRLSQRANLANVAINYQAPSNPKDVQSVGGREGIWFLGAEGSFDNVVFCDGGLRFDEDINIDLALQVLGTESLHDQENVDQRVEEMVYEVLAEIASAGFQTAVRDDPILGAFHYVIITPQTQLWNGGRLEQAGGKAHAVGAVFGINVRSRRNYP